jgi:hypothetical protein
MTAPAVLDPAPAQALPRPDGEGSDHVPTAGAVAVVVDDSAAAIAAARWAARLASEKRTSLVVVLLAPTTSGPQDLDVVLARVQPALERSGRPWTVRTCQVPGGAASGPRARRRARRVRRLVPDDVSVLVLPGSSDPRQGLAGWLARRGDLDLLVVPDLRAVDADLARAAGADDPGSDVDERSEAAR